MSENNHFDKMKEALQKQTKNVESGISSMLDTLEANNPLDKLDDFVGGEFGKMKEKIEQGDEGFLKNLLQSPGTLGIPKEKVAGAQIEALDKLMALSQASLTKYQAMKDKIVATNKAHVEEPPKS
jgi:hypothetical protein